jgi:RND family efflux transporter MFP subunit
MKLPVQRRTLVLIALVVVALALFIYVAARTGPMAPVPVTVATVARQAIAPAVFGTGTVEARYVYRIGPTASGRVRRVDVQVGERVRAGQALGEIDPVDLDQRMNAGEASVRRAQAGLAAAQAQLQDAAARAAHTETQFKRYESLLATGVVSAEMMEARRQDRDAAAANRRAAGANVEVAREELSRLEADNEGVGRQRRNLRLVAPVDGLVTARDAEAGTTVVAGQSVIEVVDPAQLWVDARFDQASAAGLRAGLPATIVLRSRPADRLAGHVLRVEPRADAVTEELLAKVTFDVAPGALPPLGELAEVTVALPSTTSAPVVANAAVQRRDGRTGVWVVEKGGLAFRHVTLGAGDLEGRVQVLDGLAQDERVVVHSARALGERTRIRVVERIP